MTAGTFRAMVIAFRRGAAAYARESGDAGDEAREFMKSVDALIGRDEADQERERSAEEWTRVLKGEAA